MLPVLISFCNAVILSPFQIVSQEFLPRSWSPPALFYGSCAKHSYCLILLSLVPKDAAAHVSNHKLHGMESPSSSTKTWKFLPSSPIPSGWPLDLHHPITTFQGLTVVASLHSTGHVGMQPILRRRQQAKGHPPNHQQEAREAGQAAELLGCLCRFPHRPAT